MKTQSQIALIALAIAFTMALSMVVATVCASALGRQPTEPDTSNGTTIPKDEAPVDPPPPTSSELRFASNGDGTCVIVGLGTCTDTCVVIPEYAPTGERVTEIGAMAFYGCESITAIQIPASVAKIGELALAACKNLGYIAVNPANTAYRDVDGVLYTADEADLLVYPPSRVGSGVTISATTLRIADMAFFDCVNLTRVTYLGSAEDWDRIQIGIRNHSLTAAAKSFEGGI